VSDPATFRDHLEFALYRPISFLLNALPEEWALGLGSALGTLCGSVFRIRRQVVEDNLASAFPDWDAKTLKGVARESYRHMGREAVAIFRLGHLGAERIRARTEIVGLDVVERALQEEGVIGVSGHLGNWEMLGARSARRG
jgi:KDO2-lipid IV(A) lauroyltransferase